MSWLSRRLEALEALGRERDRLSAAAMRGQVGEGLAVQARQSFHDALHAFAGELAGRDGVTACVVAREGVVIATAGAVSDAELLGSVSQAWLTAGAHGASRVGLGALQQMVVVGDLNKVALFRVGGVTVAILAPATAELGARLARE